MTPPAVRAASSIGDDGAVAEKQYETGLRYDTDVRVRWSDLDAYRHVNNAHVLTLLEEARVDWLFVAAVEHGVDRLQEGVVVAHVAIDYHRSIDYGVHVQASMFVAELTAASFTVGYQIFAGAPLAVTAQIVLVPVNPDTFRPRRLDALERGYLSRFAPTAP